MSVSSIGSDVIQRDNYARMFINVMPMLNTALRAHFSWAWHEKTQTTWSVADSAALFVARFGEPGQISATAAQVFSVWRAAQV
jgi:hypothetical protein